MDLSENILEPLRQHEKLTSYRSPYRGDSALEIKRLEHCMSDLISVVALPAVWTGQEPRQIVATFHDALMSMLNLDLVFTRAKIDAFGEPIEVLRTAPHYTSAHTADQICQAVNDRFGRDPQKWPAEVHCFLDGREISLVSMRLGIDAELGMVIAGSERVDFPTRAERLPLHVAANQAAVALQHARLLNEQRRIADELDRRVAERTRELAEANRELELQVGLLQHLPVSAWTLKPDGTPDFVNRVWLEFSGQTLDFVRSRPDAWITAVHPEDRGMASKAFWEGVRTGRGFAMETRSLRARDGVYRWHLQQAVVLREAEGRVLKFVGTTTDIHEQKQAEEALRASELSLRQIVDNIPGLVSTLGPNGETKLINRQILEYFGKSLEELKNWRLSDAIHPDDLPDIIALHAHSIKLGVPFGSEYRLRRADGVYRWFQFRAEPVRDAAGRVNGWYVLATDIHDRKQAEESVKASESKFASIINTIPALAWSARPDGLCDFLSQGWLDFTGLSSEQAQGWGWSDAIHPEDRDRLVQNWRSAIVSGMPVDTEARLCRYDGVYRWNLIRANPWRDESGSIVKWYGTNTDIDDRKRAEEQLRRSEAFLAEAQHLTRIGSFSWRVTANQIRWSDQLHRIYGFTPDSPLTFDLIRTRVHPDDVTVYEKMVEQARNGSHDFDWQYRLLMPEGSIKYLHAVAHAVRHEDGELEYVAAVQDVTARHRSEEALAKARAELARVARITSLGMLTASIAHEVNQPLSGIVTNAGTCLRMLDSDPPNIEGARETARRTIRDGNRASEVVTRLRALFKRKELVAEPVNLSDAAREVIVLSLSELQSKGIIVRQEFSEILPSIKGDRVQLQQVIQNLLRNASDSMSEIADRPRQLLIRTESDDGKNVQLTVQDTGIGIAPEAADRIFDPFYTTKEDGMGIGLSVSRSIVEAHCGQLWAAKNDGPGSSFIFSIPSELGANDLRINDLPGFGSTGNPYH
jgi:PAS domain S-box-containing protein